MRTIGLDGQSLTIEALEAIARDGLPCALDAAAETRVAASRAVVDACVEGELVRYGITTGFGRFCDVVISREQNALLQKNLIMSHACAVGEPLPIEASRAMLALRANALAVGNSGIRPSTVKSIVAMLNAGVTPVVPSQGSLGASGDLAPLSHAALALCGMGEAYYQGERMGAAKALSLAGLEPVELRAKEGLALINGTQCMTAIGALAAADAAALAGTAAVAAALTIEALRGIVDAFDPRVHALRRQGGQIACAADLRALLAGSSRTTRQGQERVQDAYVLRCVPQIHGASIDAIAYVRAAIARELNAVTDNPIIFPEDGAIISGGNFHGQPMALPLDFLAIAVSELANVSERRIERLVNPALSNGLPAFLTSDGGVNSGFMIAQYTAASLVSENKVLSHPASVDSIPSSANQEDHVSMGTTAARKARNVVDNATRVIAIELLAACQAIDLSDARDALAPATRAAYDAIRAEIGQVREDRIMYPDFEAAFALVRSRAVLEAAERAAGPLGSVARG
jgi:histidine ammonia-lyase